MDLLIESLPRLLSGAMYTIGLTVIAYGFALVLGTAIAVCRVSPIPPLRWFGAVYVEIFRNIPLLSLLILIAHGLPDAGLLLSYFWSGVLGLTLSSAAFICENVRSGINTVPVGHSEAARSIGLGFFGTLWHVILPQAFAAMVQPLVNVFIGTLLGSALCAAIAVHELTYVSQDLSGRSAQAVLFFLFSGVVYLSISLLAAFAGRRIERAISPATRRSKAPRAGGALDVKAGAQA